MGRRMAIARSFLLLLIIRFALAAPIEVRQVHGVHVNVVDVAEDGAATSQRWWEPWDKWLTNAVDQTKIPDPRQLQHLAHFQRTSTGSNSATLRPRLPGPPNPPSPPPISGLTGDSRLPFYWYPSASSSSEPDDSFSTDNSFSPPADRSPAPPLNPGHPLSLSLTAKTAGSSTPNSRLADETHSPSSWSSKFSPSSAWSPGFSSPGEWPKFSPPSVWSPKFSPTPWVPEKSSTSSPEYSQPSWFSTDRSPPGSTANYYPPTDYSPPSSITNSHRSSSGNVQSTPSLTGPHQSADGRNPEQSLAKPAKFASTELDPEEFLYKLLHGMI